MIKVIPKSIVDHTYNISRRETEIHLLVSTLYSERDGYVAVCERLSDEIDRMVRDDAGNKIPPRKKGDLVVHQLKNLRVVRTAEDENREAHLLDLKNFLIQ